MFAKFDKKKTLVVPEDLYQTLDLDIDFDLVLLNKREKIMNVYMLLEYIHQI